MPQDSSHPLEPSALPALPMARSLRILFRCRFKTRGRAGCARAAAWSGSGAAGAGAVISLAADLCLASEQAKFAFLFTKVGLAGADMGSAYLLPRMVGLSRATELLMLGETIDSSTADGLGLAYKVVADDELHDATAELSTRLATGPTLAYASTKMLLSRELDMDLAAALEHVSPLGTVEVHGFAERVAGRPPIATRRSSRCRSRQPTTRSRKATSPSAQTGP